MCEALHALIREETNSSSDAGGQDRWHVIRNRLDILWKRREDNNHPCAGTDFLARDDGRREWDWQDLRLSYHRIAFKM